MRVNNYINHIFEHVLFFSRVCVKIFCVSVFMCLPAAADALPGVLRWQSRLWQLVTKLRGARQLGDVPDPSVLKKKELADARKIWENKNYAIQEVAAR